MQRSSTFARDLTSNEHLLTREAGFEPIGLVMGTAFYKVSFWGYFNGYRSYTGELIDLIHAHLATRELAVSRMQQEAAILGAHSVIGVRLKMGGYDWSADARIYGDRYRYHPHPRRSPHFRPASGAVGQRLIADLI